MAVTGQIEIIEPGSGKKRFFSESGDIESDLRDAVENVAIPGSVVVMNPGDYTGVGSIDIPSEVTVVVMPGAIVSYASNFRTNGDFGATGDPTNNSNHPLRSSVNRYSNPNFTGAVENIVDLNFGSEWAFETDLEDLRQTVQGEIVGGQFFWNIESGDLSAQTQTRFSSSISVKSGASPTRTLRLEDTEGVSFNVTEGDIDKDGTDEITVRAENEGVISVAAGRLLQLGNSGVGVDPDLASARFVSDVSIASEISGSLTDFVFARGGSDLYVTDDSGTITQFSLDASYSLLEINTPPDASFDVSGEDGTPQDLVLSDDGSKLFVLGNSTNTIYEYDLGTNYDVGSATFNGNSFDVSNQTTSPTGIDLGDNDQVIIVSSSGDNTIYQYSLSAAADVTSASLDNSLDVSSEVGFATSVDFSRVGNELLVADNSGDPTIADYELEISFDVTSAQFKTSLDVSGNNSNEFSTDILVGVFVDIRAGRLIIGDSFDENLTELAIVDSGNVLIFHRDVAVDDAGFGQLGQSVPDGVRVVSDLEINKSEPPTGGGGTFDGHVKRVGAVDLVEGSDIEITPNPQTNGPDQFEISATVSGGVDVEDDGATVVGAASVLNFGEGLDVTSPNTGEARIDHGPTGANLDLVNEKVVGTDDAGHVQRAVGVGSSLSPSLEVDAQSLSLRHSVSPTPSDNTTTGTFLETIQFDDNGHVESASFSSAGGGASLSDLGLNYMDPTLELENTSSNTTIDTVDIDVLPRSIYDSNGDARATGVTDAGARNRVGVTINGDVAVSDIITDQNDTFRLDSDGMHYLASESSIQFFETRSDMSSNIASVGDIFYNINDDELSLLSSNSMDITAINNMTMVGSDGIDFKANQGKISFDTPNFGVDMNSVQKLTILGDFEFRDGFLALKPRSSDIDPANDIPDGWAAIYAIVAGTDGFGNITDIDLRWAENLEDGSTRLSDIGGS